jgi:hypothetical protein
VLGAVLGRTIEWRLNDVFVADRNSEPRAKLAKFLLVEFFLAVKTMTRKANNSTQVKPAMRC